MHLEKLLQVSLSYIVLILTTTWAQGDSVSVDKLEDIIVTGVKSEIKRSNATEYTIVLDSTDIKTANAARVEDLLKTIPGISIISPMAGNQAGINGLEGGFTKVLINGIPVVDGDGAFGLNLESIPINDIERIEIVRGAASALYGSDAMGGVINILTPKNRGTRIASVELRQRYTSNFISSKWDRPGFKELEPRDGSYDHWGGILNGSASVEHNNDRFGMRADAGYFFDIGAIDTIEKRIFGDRPYYYLPQESKKNIRLDFTTDKIFFDALDMSAACAGKSREYSAAENQKLTLNEQRLDANLRLAHVFTDVASMKAFVSAQKFQNERTRYNYDNKVVAEKEFLDFPKVESEVLSTVRAGRFNEITVGINGVYEAAEAVYIKGGHKSVTSLAPFMQDVINFSDRVLLTPGIRYTWDSRFGGEATPSLSCRLNLLPEFFFRLAAAGGYRSPDLKQVYRDEWVHTGGIFVLSGNPGLEPERSWSINGGTGGTVMKEFSWEINTHATRLVDQITTRETSTDSGTTSSGEHFDAVRQYVNNDSAYTIGTDISLNYTIPNKLRLKAAYSLLNSRFWDEEGVLKESELYSPHTVKASLYYQPVFLSDYKPALMGDIVWQSSQRYESTASGELPAYVDINVALELPVGPLGKLTLGVKNLLDNAFEEWNQAIGRTMFTELKVSITDITNPFNKQ